jgi:predicted peptidase
MMNILKILIVATGVFRFGVTKLVSQTNVTKIAEVFNARTHVSMQKDTMQYRLLTSIDYDFTKQYPLAVCLSGGAGRSIDNIEQIVGSKAAQVLSTLENRKKYPAFVLVPQCPPGSDWGRSLGGIEREYFIKHVKHNQPNVESLVFEIIDVLEDEFNIDTTRRYVTGQSMSGYESWYFILSHPEIFAAAITICSGANPDLTKNITEIPIWVFHGDTDKTAPVDFSRNMIAVIKKAEGNPKYNEFPNVGHRSWHLAFDTPKLLD